MGDFAKEILLLIKSEYDGSGVNAAIRDLDRFERRLNRVSDLTNLRVSVDGTDEARRRIAELERSFHQLQATAARTKVDAPTGPTQRSRPAIGTGAAIFGQVSARPGAQVLPDVEVLNRQAQALETVRRVLDPTTNQVFRLNTATGQVTASTTEFNKVMAQTGGTLQQAAGKVLLWAAASTAIYGTFQAARAGVRSFSELEAATVALARVGRGFTTETLGSVKAEEEIAAGARSAAEEILKLKVAFGSSGTAAQDAAVTFARLGLSQREVVESTRVALLAANVAGIDAGRAAQFLASAMSQFGLSAAQLPNILDKLNTLENTTRVRTEDLLASISRTGGVAREAGASLELLAAATATVAQATGRSGAEIGNAFKTIFTRLGSEDVQGKVFDQANIAIQDLQGNLKPVGDLLGELVVKFQNLNDAERAQITTSIAGTRQRNILQAALDNYFQTQVQVVRQLTLAGSAESENAQILQTLSAKAEQLVAAFERFAVAIGNSGVGRALKLVVDDLRVAVDTMASMGTAGVLLVGVMGAYAVSVVLAAAGTGGLTASFRALLVGAAQVNRALLSNVGSLGAYTTAAGTAATANAALAGSFGRVGAGSAAAGLGIGALARTFAPLLAALAIVEGFKFFKAKPLDPFNKDSEEGQRLDRTRQAVTQEQNRAAAMKETAATARIVAAVLEDAETKRAAGIRQTDRELQQVQAAQRAIADMSTVEAGARAKAAAGALTSADALKVAEQAEGRITEQHEAQRQAILRARSEREAQIAALEEERRILIEVGRAGGPLGSFRRIGAPKDAEESVDEALVRNNENAEELRKQVVGLNGELNALNASAIDRAFGEPMQRFETRLKSVKRELSASGFNLRINAETRPLEKVNLQLEEQLALLERIYNDPKLQADPSALREEVQAIQDRIAALRDERDIRQQTAASSEAERKARVRGDIEEAFLLDTASLAPDDEQPVARADAKIEAEKRRLRFLEEFGASAEAIDKQRARVAEQEELRITAVLESEALKRKRIADADRRAFEQQRDKRGATARFRETVTGDDADRGIREAEAQLAVEKQIGREVRERLAFLESESEVRALSERELIEAQRLRAHAAEQEQRIEEAKLDVYRAQLEAVQRQTEEARRTAEQEAKRRREALGQLSDIDLARTRILAGQVKRGEFKGFTEEQFLSLDQESRGFLSGFDKLFPGSGAVPAGLSTDGPQGLPAAHEEAVTLAMRGIPELHRQAVLEALGRFNEAADNGLEIGPRKQPGAAPGTVEELLQIGPRARGQIFLDGEPWQPKAQGIYDGRGERVDSPRRPPGIYGEDGSRFDPPAPVEAQQSASANLNVGVNVNLDGLEAKLDQAVTSATLLMTEGINEIVEKAIRRADGNRDALKYRIPTRT